MTATLQKTYGHNNASVQLDTLESIKDVYSYHARHFAGWLREREEEINIQSVRNYFQELNNTNYAANTKRIKRQAVKKRIRQIMKNADIETKVKLDQALKDVDKETAPPKSNGVEIEADKYLSLEEWQVLFSKARGPRQRAFLLFLYHTGCRVSEMLNIRLSDVRTEEDKVFIRITGKGNKERYVRLDKKTYDIIRDTFRGEEYLFETRTGKLYSRSYVSDQIAKLGRYAIHKKISAHTLRHTFATRMIRKTGKIKAVSKYLGHSSTSITLNMYVHESLDDAELFD